MLLLDEKKILVDSLAEGVNMKFDEFVQFNSIYLDSIIVDKFFHNIRNDMHHFDKSTYMNQDMIEYFGYSGIILEKTNNVKIGWCWNLPKRVQCLQIGNSQKLKVIKTEITQFPYEREQYLHQLYKNSHIRGEWYKINI